MTVERHFLYRGGRRVVPQNISHVHVHKSLKVIPAMAFFKHRNIVEVICHNGVERIERQAFAHCPSLRRVVIRGVEVIESDAFRWCRVLTYVECRKLERIGEEAFGVCKSLRGINLLCVNIVERLAFANCTSLTEATFGQKIESIRDGAFDGCVSLERITIPLKHGLITNDDVFRECQSLRVVKLVEEEALYETSIALQLKEWRNEMNYAMESISQTLPNAPAGDNGHVGEKARTLRRWITRFLRTIVDCKQRHQCLLHEDVMTTLHHALPCDVVLNSILPFLELPLYTFDGEEEDGE